jgi:divalent metal cation (Fe/Co/Zn/Cd) transporter
MTGQKWKVLSIRALHLYTLLVTLITVLMIILGNLLDRDRVFSYDAFFSPLIYALIGTVATMITRSDKELSVRSLIIRKAISLLIVEGAIVFIALNADTIPTEKSWVLPGIVLGVFVVFILTHVILYFINRKEAEKLNADLTRYQERQKNDSPVHE